MLKQKPAPVVRSSVGNSGGRYMVNRLNTPEKKPTAGNQHHTRACQGGVWRNVPAMVAKNPMNNTVMARR